MATGFKLDPKTGEPLHLVFAGGSSYIDYVVGPEGNISQVAMDVPAPPVEADTWFPESEDVFEAIVDGMRREGGGAFALLRDKHSSAKQRK